jgi:AcrR family transcriptional regulator
MTSRAESAAATGRALLAAASGLLDEGGPDAVTLRAVGSRAGVSRGAPYGHFVDKEGLLAALATAGWAELTGDLERIRADDGSSGEQRLLRAVLAYLSVARERPHLYALMFTTPTRDPETLIEAASRAQDVFLAIVAGVVGDEDARRSGALLITSAHGIAGMESSGQLSESKWGTSGDRMLQELIALLALRR